MRDSIKADRFEFHADRFARLDHMVTSAPREMPDEIFDQLVEDWADAALSVAHAPAVDRRSIVLKLAALARVLSELDVGIIGDRELTMANAIARDLARLAGVPKILPHGAALSIVPASC